MPDDTGSAKSSRKPLGREAHWLEWATGLISAALVLTMVGWLAWQAAGEEDGKPELVVQAGPFENTDGGHRIAFTIVNRGKRTAAAVPVTARLYDRDRLVEEREVTLDYVPALSSTSGALLFGTDPGTYRLDIRASGYEDP